VIGLALAVSFVVLILPRRIPSSGRRLLALAILVLLTFSCAGGDAVFMGTSNRRVRCVSAAEGAECWLVVIKNVGDEAGATRCIARKYDPTDQHVVVEGTEWRVALAPGESSEHLATIPPSAKPTSEFLSVGCADGPKA
jgi:hypothetical protein